MWAAITLLQENMNAILGVCVCVWQWRSRGMQQLENVIWWSSPRTTVTPAGLVNLLDCELYLFINLSIYFGEGGLEDNYLRKGQRGQTYIIRYILEFIRHLPSVDCRNCYLLHLLWVSVKSLCGLRIREKWNYNKWLTLVWL